MAESENSGIAPDNSEITSSPKGGLLEKIRSLIVNVLGRAGKESTGNNHSTYMQERLEREYPAQPSNEPQRGASKLYPEKMFNITPQGDISVSPRVGPNPNDKR